MDVLKFAFASDNRERLAAWVERLRAVLGPRPLENPRNLLVAVAGTLFLLVVWAALVDVERVVRVEGRLIPAGKSQQIQHLEGGIVATIDTAEGATVAKGDRLLTIDNTSADATVGESQAKLSSERIRVARLQAEAEGRDGFALPAELAGSPSAAVERQLFLARKQKADQEIRVYSEQLQQKSAELHDVISRKKRLEGELETARQRSTMISNLLSRNAASQMEVLDAKSREQRLQTEIGDAEGAAPKLRAAVAEMEARVQEARARFRAEAQAELSKSMSEIERLEQVLTSQSDRLTRTEVRAPVSGVVNRLSVTTVGGVIKPGETIAEITPFTSTLQIEARATPKDRGELRAGLPAHIRISAHDVASLGVLGGRVIDVGADTITDSKGDSYYRVTLLVDNIPPSYEGRLMTPGMTTTGDIVIGKRTMLNYLLSPFNKFAYNAFRDAK
jgi:adhesin transport system membrane fusion protein